MPPELAIWLNRAGLILDLVAFFFAAPEILGEGRLISIENWFERMGKAVFLVMVLVWVVIAFIAIIDVPQPPPKLENTGAWLSVYIPKLVRGAIISFGGILLFVGLAKLGDSLLKLMADDSQIRRRSLLFGMLLFVLGEVFQLAATF